jgi:hypothetical protein
VSLETTPDYLVQPRVPSLLLSLMAPALHARARFIVSFREPTDRFLSWYNHRRIHLGARLPFCTRPGTDRWPVLGQLYGGAFHPTFDEEARCELGSWAALRERCAPHAQSSPTDRELAVCPHSLLAGHYAAHLQRWVTAGWARQQILVLDYATLTRPGSAAIAAIVRHVAVLGVHVPRDAALPQTNGAKQRSARSPASRPYTERMCCGTYCALQAHFAPLNSALYAALADDRANGRSPPHEPAFAPFEPPECERCNATVRGDDTRGPKCEKLPS